LCDIILFVINFFCPSTVDRWTSGGHAAWKPECGQRPDDRPRASLVQPGHNAVQPGAVRTLRNVHWGWRRCDGCTAVLSWPLLRPLAPPYLRPCRPPGTVRREILFFSVSPGTSKKTADRPNRRGRCFSSLIYKLLYTKYIYIYIYIMYII